MSEGWSRGSIDSVLTAHFSGAWGTEPKTGDAAWTVLRSTDIDDDGHVDLGTGAKRQLSAQERRAKVLGPGDILLEASGGGPGKPVGRPAWFQGDAPGSFTASNFFRVLRPDPLKVDSRFLLWKLLYLSHLPEIWQFQQQTTGIINLKLRDYLQAELDVPPAWEQRRIAEILDALDDKICRFDDEIMKSEMNAAGLAGDLLTNNAPASRKRSKQDEWIVGPLANYKSSSRPYLKTGPFGSSLKQEHWVPEGVPVVTIGSLGAGNFIQSELLHVSIKTAQRLHAYVLEPGDVVFSRVADVGRSVVVSEAERGWIMSSNMMWISLDQSKVDPRFLRAAISVSPSVRMQIRRLVNSSGRDVANAAIMNRLEFTWPPIAEQREIADIIDSQKAVSDSLRRSRDKLISMKQGLMADLLTGYVRVPAEAVT